jgi:hypothetical protein
MGMNRTSCLFERTNRKYKTIFNIVNFYKSPQKHTVMKFILSFLVLVLSFAGVRADNGIPPYKDPSQPVDTRVKDLLSRMTPD